MDQGESERSLEQIPVEEVRRALLDMAEHTRSFLPLAYSDKPDLQTLVASAYPARIVDHLLAIGALADLRKASIVGVLTRSLYEHVVTFCWLMISPDTHVFGLLSRAEYRQQVLIEKAIRFGVEVPPLGTQNTEGTLPALDQMAKAADSHWSKSIRGFRSSDDSNPLLSLEGLYTGFYQIASKTAHAQVDSLDPNLHPLDNGVEIRPEDDPRLINIALAVPLAAHAFIVSQATLGWPDEHEVRRINDQLV